jgi:hypothetical protein
MAETYLTPVDLAERTGYSIDTLARWRCEGKGPEFMKPGGNAKQARVRYRLSAVEAWERAQTFQNTGKAA